MRDRAEPMAQVRETAIRTLFGDRYGLVVFLACLCLFGVVWRTGVFITDSYTLANGLYAVTNGEVFMTEAAYGGSLDTPGAEQAPGGLIARNYGAILLSLPFWGILEGLSAVTSLRVALLGLWSLALLALVVQLGGLLDNENVVVIGSVAVLAVFGLNVAVAHPLDSSGTHFYALQLFHMVVAAFAPVILYRLLGRIHDRRLGLLGATLLLLGTPLSVWAPFPKRHALTVTVVLAIAYALYRSRTGADGVLLRRPVWFRALAYVVVGLYTWVHAPEALLLFLGLLVLDVPTAPDNGVRTLAIVGGAFLLSLLPFLITNTVVVGSPLQPPRLLAVQGTGAGTTSGSGPSQGSPEPAVALLMKFASPILVLGGELSKGLAVLGERPSAVYHTLIRSGGAAAALDNAGKESVNLSVLESAPLLAAMAGVVPVLWRRLPAISLPERTLSGRALTDLFAVLIIVTLTLQYASRLPIHAQLTVRYLFPLYPLGVYLVCRLPVVNATLTANTRLFAWTTAVATLIGGQLLVVAIFSTVVGLGEAFQLHAVLALAVAVPLVTWAMFGRSDDWFGRIGAVLFGFATAVTTLFTLLVAIEYYPVANSHMLPAVRILGELLRLF